MYIYNVNSTYCGSHRVTKFGRRDIRSRSHALTCYSALSRVRRREDILIYRALHSALFRKGEPSGPVLLPAHLRGERLDWDAVEKQVLPDCAAM